ncbi:MAG: heme-dependent oxidative N-demethylase subunit alpha family protein [Pseudomonadales bacterium]
MGLREIGERDWLAEPISADERARKRRLLQTQRELVMRRVPGFESVEAGMVRAVTDALRQRGQSVGSASEPFSSASEPFSSASEPAIGRLETIALEVADDLCLLIPEGGAHRLVSACLCSPSYWRLGEKIGKPMHAVHGPVRGLNEAIGSNVQHFLDRLPLGRIFQRRNWLIHQHDEPFHPDDELWPESLQPADCQRLFVRSETQTLRKFAAGAVLFTIRVRSHPLAQIAGYPEAAADLLIGIDRMSADERHAFGYHHHGAALSAFLQNLTARSA